ncbi:MAG: hypothetical protein ACI9F9_000888 [Candidatus Paceibacteria bacterium]|jgi:hypothetical protein
MTVVDIEAQPEAGALERFTDRLNPILLKEVRQAMRGRYFKYSFWLTLTIATLVGLSVCLVTLMDQGPGAVLGPSFFVAMFGCLVVAAQIFVPFSAFLSMGGEWDENTWDLLVLSNLRPKQIVLGKVLSASLQSLLFYCAFGPFLVFAFLLRGVDLTVLLSALSLSFVLATLLSCLAVAMSSFGRGKFARVILMVLLAVVLVQSSVGVSVWAGAMMFNPAQIHDKDMLMAIAGAITVGVAIAAFFFAAACARLAHPEENRSTGLRVMALVVVASALGWLSWMMWGDVNENPLIIMPCIAIGFLFATSAFFSTEEERLGRRVALTLPRNRILTTLITPLLPGGARGILFFLFASLGVCLWMLIYPGLADSGFSFRGGQRWIPFVMMAYGLVYLGLPGALASKQLNTVGRRSIARVIIVVLLLTSILVPALLGFLFHNRDWAQFEHPGNVFMVIDALWKKPMRFSGPFITVTSIMGAVYLLNFARIRRAFKEQQTALANLPQLSE